jgi:hypothetical protein
MANLFGMAGIPSFYQPVKTMARFELSGTSGAQWTLPPGDSILFSKETSGPYTYCEALLNPVQCIIEAGWPADRLHLLILDRNPISSLDSWIEKWKERTGRVDLVQNYILSTANYVRMRSYAEQNDIAMSHFPYEASKNPHQVIRHVFSRAGAGDRYDDEILHGWGAAGDLNSGAARICYPREPRQYVVPSLHSSSDSYRYQERAIMHLTPEEISVASQKQVDESYRESVQRFCDEIGPTTMDYEHMFDMPQRVG